MSTLDATFTTVYASQAAGRSDSATSTARPSAHADARDRNASRAERAARRRQDAVRHERDARRDEQMERARDNAAARHPLGLR
ncbi:hypothetical protein GCM10027059_21000 [Myceligenerans halotolerans]